MMIYALHGFLGRPHDWNVLFEGHFLHSHIHAVDLFDSSPLPLHAWAETFNNQVAKDKSAKRIVLGYSLGGRLAMHALLQQPKLWDAAILISTHPGIETVSARQSRRHLDEEWAMRFEHEPWEHLMEAWNGRAVFQRDAFRFTRHEADYQRDVLAAVLRQWSLGAQQGLSMQLAQLDLPILWMAGGGDADYARVAKETTFKHAHSRVAILPGVGHRVPWQAPGGFLEELMKFINPLRQETYDNNNVSKTMGVH